MNLTLFQTSANDLQISANIETVDAGTLYEILELKCRNTYSMPLLIVINAKSNNTFTSVNSKVKFYDIYRQEMKLQYSSLNDLKLNQVLSIMQPLCYFVNAPNPYYQLLVFEFLYQDNTAANYIMEFVYSSQVNALDIGSINILLNCDKQYYVFDIYEFCNIVSQKQYKDSCLEEAFITWRNATYLKVYYAKIMSFRGQQNQYSNCETDSSYNVQSEGYVESKQVVSTPSLPSMSTVAINYNIFLYQTKNVAPKVQPSLPNISTVTLKVDYSWQEIRKYQQYAKQQLLNQYGGNKAFASNLVCNQSINYYDFKSFLQQVSNHHSSIKQVAKALRPLYEPIESDIYIELHVYKLTKTGILTSLGVGIHHSGWCFDNLVEIGYGYIDNDGTGVYAISPCCFNAEGPIEKINIGKKKFNRKYLCSKIIEGCELYPGRSYDLLRYNCNDFSDYIARVLGLGEIPDWINRAAKIGQKFTKEKQTGGVEVGRK